MFYIDELTGTVMLNRGDDASFTLHINEGSNIAPIQYPLKKEDCIYFAIEEPNQPFENAIVKKVINLRNNLLDKNGNITFDIQSKDTYCLMPGKYFYEIKMKLYKSNQFRNGYMLISLDYDTNQYSIIDQNKTISTGYFTKNCLNEISITFIDSKTDEHYIATLNDDLLTFNDYPIEFGGLTFKQESDKVNTIIPQTEWIVER